MKEFSLLLLLLLLKYVTPAQVGKTERLQNCRATPQAPAPLKKKKTDAKEADYD